MKKEKTTKIKYCEKEGLIHNGTKKDLWMKMMMCTGVNMSYSTFCQRTTTIHKANRRTDVCGACLRKVVLEKKKETSEFEKKELSTLIEHVKQATMTREEYRSQIDALGDGEMLIVLDFKQDWELPYRFEQPGRDFYTRQKITHLGVVAFVGGGVQGPKKKIAYHFLSEVITKDIHFIEGCLRQVIEDVRQENERMKRIMSRGRKDEKLSVWVDCGTHFRNGYLLASLFSDSESSLTRSFSSVSLSFFAEGHGKSDCDGEFGAISRIVMQKSRDMITIEDLMKFFEAECSIPRERRDGWDLSRRFRMFDQASRLSFYSVPPSHSSI